MRVKLIDDVIFARFDEEAALLNLKNGKYFSLNETAFRVWELLMEYNDTDQVLEAMLKEYNTTDDLLKADLSSIVSRLMEAELVKTE